MFFVDVVSFGSQKGTQRLDDPDGSRQFTGLFKPSHPFLTEKNFGPYE